MADNDEYNEEYQFADLDAVTPDSEDHPGASEGNAPEVTPESPRSFKQPNVKRNAIIVVGIVIVIMVLYKIIGSIYSEKKAETNAPIAPIPVTQQTPAPSPAPTPVPVETQPTPSVTETQKPGLDIKVNQKLSTLELTQQNMRSEVSSVNDQITGLSQNVNTLVTKMSELNGVIANLSAKVEEQSRELEKLTIQRTVAKVIHHQPTMAHPRIKYFIQAVIPGRAWLIASNGTTLTVREGTIIAGYGIVKLIDPNQGRVLTSSGQVIRFSQEDS